MRAVILAGGRGTRLEPYTTVFPKPLIPIGHRPIIDIIIRQLARRGFTTITLSVGYLAELIQAYFQNINGGLDALCINYVKEKAPLGTAGSLRSISGLDRTFLVMNGDILTTLDYKKLVEYHNAHNALLTISMHKKKVKIDLGVLETDSAGNLTGYLEKPEKEYAVSMGIYVYNPRVLNYIEPNTYLDFPDLVLRLLASGEKVIGFPSDDYWLDIGRHEDYVRAQEEFEQLKDKLMPGEDRED